MVEVGQRFGTGAYRLTVLRKSQSRPVAIGESPVPLLVSCTFKDSLEGKETSQDRGEVSDRRATQCTVEKVSRLRSGESAQVHWNLHCISSSVMDSSRLIDFVHRRSGRQSNNLPARMTPWTRRAFPIQLDNLQFSQQHRAFCMLVFILSGQASERSGGGLRFHPDILQACTAFRSCSRRSYSGLKNIPPLFRSRTAYYDILKVSINATQSQIKTAYYKQSFIYHPDKNPGNDEATQHFSEISEAYTVLGSISLRRKYDRGILSQSDIQSAGRPSSKESVSRSTGPHQHQQQQHQQRARRFSKAGEKTMFDFDAFYKAHYGEQLQREKDMKARKQHMEEQQKKQYQKWKEGKMMEMTAAMLLAIAGLLFMNLNQR